MTLKNIMNSKQKPNLDLIARQVLMSSYLYYRRNVNVISDELNDEFCCTLSDNWDNVPLRYKPLLDPDNTGGQSIRSTTFRCRYTLQIEAGAIAWHFNHKGVQLRPLRQKDGCVSGKQLEDEMEVYDLF